MELVKKKKIIQIIVTAVVRVAVIVALPPLYQEEQKNIQWRSELINLISLTNNNTIIKWYWIKIVKKKLNPWLKDFDRWSIFSIFKYIHVYMWIEVRCYLPKIRSTLSTANKSVELRLSPYKDARTRRFVNVESSPDSQRYRTGVAARTDTLYSTWRQSPVGFSIIPC